MNPAAAPNIEPEAKPAAIIASLMTVFIVLHTPNSRVRSMSPQRPGLFPTPTIPSDTRRNRRVDGTTERRSRCAFRQDFVVPRAAVWRVSAINWAILIASTMLPPGGEAE
jgi:hypothetical protein